MKISCILPLKTLTMPRPKLKVLKQTEYVKDSIEIIQEEFYTVAFRKKIYRSIEEIQTDLNNWMWCYNNERTHSGKCCYGKTSDANFY